DRIPREAAICGCCLVTGMQGSAANSVDVPVPGKYKFDESGSDVLSRVAAMLVEILGNYDLHARDLDACREAIMCQEKCFEHEVSTLFTQLSQP
ncbi:hypothetical protein MNBD_GAMMA15-2365, partial [hydrothermal vent metagenome]